MSLDEPWAKDQAPGLVKYTRLFSGIPAMYQSTKKIAEKIKIDYNPYKKPLLTSGELLLLITCTWDKAHHQLYQITIIVKVEYYICQMDTT